MYQITIPVKPFVAKYIYARYRQNVWQIDRKDRIGKIMFNMLERVPRGPLQPPPELGAQLPVRIIYQYAQNKGVYISNRSIMEFNEQIQQELIEEIALYANRLQNHVGIKKYDELYINQTSAYGRSRTRAIINPDVKQYFETKEIIHDIFKQYDITEDDYPYENIKKQLRRLKLPMLSN
ncbi:hypothetical protein KHS38_12055 [Mucilaginibacter sp. Bleaf8]|uniref:hypothetical protein n=1 Tax=Mucilaginibacter sp. Bleaf8 TaxID=2834430 RepID=UPI001BCC58E7|nr:hypothetical protein [Mucilaginibacter sp. Bleaf8]MBS7565138.1 hypothetical protein [Mucilaginibacter sp. Bleaf8]